MQAVYPFSFELSHAFLLEIISPQASQICCDRNHSLLYSKISKIATSVDITNLNKKRKYDTGAEKFTFVNKWKKLATLIN